MTHCSITKVLYSLNEKEAANLSLKTCHHILVTHTNGNSDSNTYTMNVWTNANADINKLLNYWNAIGQLKNVINMNYHYTLEKSENRD
jgi:hypothetical protein